MCLLEVELDGVVAAVEGVVARGLVRAQLDDDLAGALKLLHQLLPDDDDIAVESDAGCLEIEELSLTSLTLHLPSDNTDNTYVTSVD